MPFVTWQINWHLNIMPLTPAYTWSETENSILLTVHNVPIKDQNQILCSDRVVKLNAPPYLLLLDLKDTIDDERSVATVSQGRNLTFQLSKTKPGIWGSLVAEGDKKAIRQIREESVQRAHQKQVAAHKERLARKDKEEKAAISHQIDTEKKQRDRIEALKQQELEQERQQLQDWQQHLSGDAHLHQQDLSNTHQVPAGDESDYEDEQDTTESVCPTGSAAADAHSAPKKQLQGAMLDHPDYYGRGWRPSKVIASSTTATTAASNKHDGLLDDSTDVPSTAADDHTDILHTDSSERQGQSVMDSLVSEAAAAASEIWDAVPTYRNSSTEADTVHDEQLLTELSTSTTKPPGSLTGSVANHQQHAVQQQPASVVAAVKPPRPPAPVRCMAESVAVSFTQLQTQHLPAREQREIEIRKIKRQDKGDSVDISDRQPAFLKDKGDALAVQGNYRAAINAFTRAIELDPNQPALWSNRAACHLALGAAADCNEDCSRAISLLPAMHARLVAAGPAATAAGEEMLAGMLPSVTRSTAAVGVEDAAQSTAETATAEDLEVAVELSVTSGAGNAGEQGCSARLDAGPAVSAAASADTTAEGCVSNTPAALEKLQQQFVKVLARRAAARVELHQLQEAADDLQQALRLDPENNELKADALEVAAMLNPASAADPAAMKQRADARFKAGDMQGAVEAYTAIAELLGYQGQQQPPRNIDDGAQDGYNGIESSIRGDAQQQAQHQLMVAVLSNRSACWLSLEMYQSCIEDCLAALTLALSTSRHSCNDASCTSTSGNDSSSTAQESAINALECIHQGDQSVALTGYPLPLLLGQPQLQPVRKMLAAGAAGVRSIARLLSRLAVAYGCLKQLEPAVQLYELAKVYWQELGDMQRVAALAADQEKLQLLLTRDSFCK